MALKPKGRARLRAIQFAVLFGTFLLATPTVLAQLRSLDVSQYLHTSWSAQDGFFTGGINSVTQASDGYLWLTSSAGLLRFDGIRFVQWKPPAHESLPGAPLRPLLASKDGSLWIGGTGLAELTATGEFRRYHQLDGIEVAALVEGQDGAIWAGGVARPGSAPLCRVFRTQAECYGDTKYMGGWVDSLYEDKKGRLWAGTNDGIWRVRPGLPQRVVPYPSVVRTFAEDASGTLLFSDAREVKALGDDGKVRNYPVLPDGKSLGAWKILRDREGSLWFATGGQGLVHVHEGRVDRFTTLDGLAADAPKNVFQDHEGSLWVTSNDSLDRFTKPAVPRITTKQGLPSNLVTSVVTRRDGTTWIATDPGLSELSGNRPIGSNTRLSHQAINSLFETSSGRLLVSVDIPNGMIWLDGGKIVPLRVKSGENTFEIAEDRQGDLWMMNRESGLLHLRGDGSLVESFSRDVLGLPASTVAFDPKRNGLWLSSARGELVFFKNGKVVERYGVKDGLTVGVLRDLQVDGDGAVWVSTQSGLARLMDGKIAVLGQQSGLPCDAVHWMRHDDDQNVWLYTKCGLVSFSDKDLSSWIAQPSHVVTIRSYLDNTEGVENTTYGGWYTPQTAKTPDGRILFAMTSGLGILDPRDLHQNTLPPPVYVEEVTVDGREIKLASHLSLPKRARTLHFAFTALSLVAPRKVRFRYKLEGYDKDWSGPVSVREATYTNLPPGDYEFRVIACNNDGVWNEAGAQLAFTIPPAFTQSIWFKAICLLGFIGIVYSAYRFRVRQVTLQLRGRMYERLAERERIARDLHDTFFQGIQGLLLRFHTATSQLRKEEPARRIFEETLKQSDQVMLEGRELVLDLRATASEQNDLPTAFSDFGEGMRRGSSCDFEVVVNGAIRSLHPVVFEELFKIGKEALSNSFVHSGAHSIEVELNYERSELRIRIRDDGTGIDSEILRQGHREGHFGLPGMRERAQRVGAHLDVWSGSGAGTEVELRIAARIAYASEPNGSMLGKLRRLWNGPKEKGDSHKNEKGHPRI
jgi:signal transduction histidine kinase/ligand-binding sensor domain-containing protein